MEIHILLAGVEFGPYTDDQARQLVGEGFLSATDPAKRLNETEWVPLNELLDKPGETTVIPARQLFAPTAELPERASLDAWKAAVTPPAPETNPPPSPVIEDSPKDAHPFLTTWEKPARAPVPTGTPAEAQPPQAPGLPKNFFAPGKPASAPMVTGPITPPRPVTPLTVASTTATSFSVGTRGGRLVRTTGSLLAKEALEAARNMTGTVLLPTAAHANRPATTESAPAPVEAISPAAPENLATSSTANDSTPTKPRSPIVLKNREEEVAPPESTKPKGPIRLTQPLTFAPRPPEEKAAVATSSAARPVTGEVKQAQPIGPSSPPATASGGVKQSLTKPFSFQAPSTVTMPLSLKNPPTKSKSLSLGEPAVPAPGPALAGELAEKRSLKITGALKQAQPHPPVRLSTSSAFKAGDSGPLTMERSDSAPRAASATLPAAEKIWPPEAPGSASTTRSVPEARAEAPAKAWETGPLSTKIPLSHMPPEGIRVQSRRSTGRIVIPAIPLKNSGEIKVPRSTSLPENRPTPEPPAASVAPAQEVPSPTVPAASATLPAAAEMTPPPTASEPAASVASPEIARPDQIRLRRPVKLELSSKAKIQDSGRLTLEAFSKMASLATTPKVVNLPSASPPPSMAEARKAPPLSVDHPSRSAPLAPPPPSDKPAGTASTAPAAKPENLPAPLDGGPALPEPDRPRETALPRRWQWLIYAIIALGLIAAVTLVVIYFAERRPVPADAAATDAPAAESTPSTTPPAEATPAPSSADAPASTPPPETTGTTPPVAQTEPAPATPAVPPPDAAPTSPPAAPAPPAPDVNGQVAAYVTEGIADYQKGSLDLALLAFNHALDLNPKSSEALYNRGLVKASQEDLDGAIADYAASLQLDPKNALAYYYRGLAEHSKGRLDPALDDYNSAIQIDSKNPLAFFNRGLVRMQKDDIDGAIVDAGRALELDPHLVQAYYNRGLGRLAKGALDPALGDLRNFCQLAPQQAYTDYARLYIWLIRTQQGQMAEANQELAQAMNRGWNGANDAMVTKIGEYLLGQIGENDLVNFAASPTPVKDQGQHCEIWYFIGLRHLLSGDKETAALDLRKCIQTQKADYCEYILAQEALKTLSPGGVTDGVVHLPPLVPVAVPVARPVDPAAKENTPAAATPHYGF